MSRKTPRQVHVAIISNTVNGKTYTSAYLRRTFREDGKVKHETLGDLSDLPGDLLDAMRRRLAGGPPLVEGDHDFEILRSLPHGHVAATMKMANNIGLENLLGSRRCRERDLVMAMIVDRVISPGSKLSCCTELNAANAQSTLAEELRLGEVGVHELYAAMDWLLARQKRIENKLAKRHLEGGTLVLFDVSSSYYTGRKSELVKHGHSRDHRRDRPQIVYGLLCDPDGRPIAVEVLPGNTADPKAFTRVVETVRNRFGIATVVFVGDRGMITSARIREDLRDVDGLEWISALRSDGVKKLVEAGHVCRSLFDETDLAEIADEENFPGERLVVCRNPLLADERARKREALLKATEAELDKIACATQRERNPLRGEQAIVLRVGKVIGKFKMAKHFEWTATADSFTYARRAEAIAEEAARDGLYVVRTSLAKSQMNADKVVTTYKSLSKVERAFRSLKTVDLQVRPIHHHNDDRIRAHVFLCMLAYYLEWHVRQALQEVLFDDHEREAAEAERESVVAPAPRSKAAKQKDATRVTADGFTVQSFQDLLKDMGTLCRNLVRIKCRGTDAEFERLTVATDYQRRVLALLDAQA